MAARELNDEEWTIEPGAEMRRQEVHDLYGGNRQAGIAPVGNSVNILVFTGAGGKQYGYEYDRWHDDGTFHYTGEGKVGDQDRTSQGNKALADPGRRIRLFTDGERKTYVKYVGEFCLAEGESAVYEERSRDVEGNMRTVVVFELWPVDDAAAAAENADVHSAFEQAVPVETRRVGKYAVNPRTGPTSAERKEAKLVERYITWLNARHHAVNGRRIRLPGAPSLNVDLFDEKLRELIEAKSNVSRHSLRYALGQVQDYARHVDHDQLAVLVPEKPPVDLVDLLSSYGITCIYEVSSGDFERIETTS